MQFKRLQHSDLVAAGGALMGELYARVIAEFRVHMREMTERSAVK